MVEGNPKYLTPQIQQTCEAVSWVLQGRDHSAGKGGGQLNRRGGVVGSGLGVVGFRVWGIGFRAQGLLGWTCLLDVEHRLFVRVSAESRFCCREVVGKCVSCRKKGQ